MLDQADLDVDLEAEVLERAVKWHYNWSTGGCLLGQHLLGDSLESFIDFQRVYGISTLLHLVGCQLCYNLASGVPL